MSRFKLLVVLVTALGLAVPAMAHHKDDHEISGNANGHDKLDNPNKGAGHGPNDANHDGKHPKWTDDPDD